MPGGARVRVPLSFGDGYSADAEPVTFHGPVDGREHLALVLGSPGAAEGPLERLHSECLTGVEHTRHPLTGPAAAAD